MENKINIAELLKDCPKGMELDCTMFDNVTFEGLDPDGYPIKIKVKGDDRCTYLTENGCWNKSDNAKCVIYPKGKTTWEGFIPPCKFKNGDIISNGIYVAIFYKIGTPCHCTSNSVVYYYCYYSQKYCKFKKELDFGIGTFTEFKYATEEEKQKLFDAIKANGYKWNEETKTLEKLVKFDINTLKPFDEVLARCSTLDKWRIQLFEKYDKTCKYPFICMGYNKYKECIPYKGNEHLLDTTDDCDEYYKTY